MKLIKSKEAKIYLFRAVSHYIQLVSVPNTWKYDFRKLGHYSDNAYALIKSLIHIQAIKKPSLAYGTLMHELFLGMGLIKLSKG
jgi:hypothetical protein